MKGANGYACKLFQTAIDTSNKMNDEALREAFQNAKHLLHAGEAARAADACRAALAAAPDNVDLLTLLGVALLGCRRPREAIPPLRRAVALAPYFTRARENLGQAHTMLGQLDEALDQLQRAAVLDPKSTSIPLKLAHVLAMRGEGEAADLIYESAFEQAPDRRRLVEAAEHLRAERLDDCAAICRELLQANGNDVNALRLLSRVAGERERWGRAEKLLLRVLELAPGFHEARLDLVRVYKQQDRLAEALSLTEDTIRRSPNHAQAHYLHASMLALAGRNDEALAAYRQAIGLRAFHPAAWIGMGHLLKTLGHQAEGIAAYRKAIEQAPNFGEVYWSLANLKTFRFSDEEIADMQRRLDEEPLDEDARVHFLFALGKALEDRGDHAPAFKRYAEAAAIQRMRVNYDAQETEVINRRIRETFTAPFIAAHAAPWEHAPIPVFIVGLPRSGSTLIEQVLASHSQVEGTAELPDVGRVIGLLNAESPQTNYPEAVAALDAAGLHRLGAAYLERTERRRQGLPFFTDKMPNNFPSIGLIHLMLPNALIVDARRHPLDSCFGTFKQHFAHGQAFSYDLEEIGEYYLEYRRMMRHWQAVLPGRVLEVRYEDMVLDLEGQVRRLLAHCGLPFEEACLRFWETERAVRTASSEQVRQPIYTSSLNHWQHFRAELAPLIEVLGEELDGWDD